MVLYIPSRPSHNANIVHSARALGTIQVGKVETGKNSEDEKKLISSFSSTILADALVILMFMMTTKLLT